MTSCVFEFCSSRNTPSQALWCVLSNGEEILARLAKSDINEPYAKSLPIPMKISEAEYEVALYEVLYPESDIRLAALLSNRIPQMHEEDAQPKDILGRRLCVFEAPEGEKNVWWDLGPEDKVSTLLIWH